MDKPMTTQPITTKEAKLVEMLTISEAAECVKGLTKWRVRQLCLNNFETHKNISALINKFMSSVVEWNGTATDLFSELKKIDGNFYFNASYLSKKLRTESLIEELKNSYNLNLDFKRNGNDKQIYINRITHGE